MGSGVSSGLLMICISCSAAWCLPLTCDAAISIDWEIGNRFRAFDYTNGNERATTEQSADMFARFAPHPSESFLGESDAERQKPIQSWIERVIEAGGSPYAKDPGPWIEDRVKNQPRYAPNFVELPKHIFFKARLTGYESDLKELADKECSWRLNGTEFARKLCRDVDPIVHTGFPSSGAEVTVYQGSILVASITVTPKLRIILGLGDSYASGEGNPDAPTVWQKKFRADQIPSMRKGEIHHYVETPAVWWSARCDRSFYSYQNLVALRLAARDKHSVISFVHLACSGAEIVDGVLAPQRFPPGHSVEGCKPSRDRANPDEHHPRCDVPYSQLKAAITILCRKEPTPDTGKIVKEIQGMLKGLRHGQGQWRWVSANDLSRCPKEDMRDVDRVLLSIGGNDIGFSGIVSYGLLPKYTGVRFPIAARVAAWVVGLVRKEGAVVCPYTRSDEACSVIAADVRISDLPRRYRALGHAMDNMLRIHKSRIVLNQYPNSLMRDKEDYCSNVGWSTENNQWSATRILLNVNTGFAKKWQINLTEGESRDVYLHDLSHLNENIHNAASNLGWSIAPLEDVMIDHGWCKGSDMIWQTSSALASEWSPYMANERFVRTANDSFLTQWPSRQRENGFYGMFHPNAQGHAAMANGVLNVIKENYEENGATNRFMSLD